VFSNDALTSLEGLSNLSTIDGKLCIESNDTLTNLLGLNNLSTIGGVIFINSNMELINIEGLANINTETISGIYIIDNISLSFCNINSICQYIANTNNNLDIFYNAPSCNSAAEVEEACLVSVESYYGENETSIYPNPSKNKLFLSSKNGVVINEVNIYNQLGQIVLHEHIINGCVNISTLENGIYFIELITDRILIRKKLIVEK